MEGVMKGLWLEGRKMSFRNDLPLPILEADEVLIKVLLRGVCSTDLEMVKGYCDFVGVPGREFVGLVVDDNGHPELLGAGKARDRGYCLDKYDCLHIIRGDFLQVKGSSRGLPLRKPPFPQTPDVGVTPVVTLWIVAQLASTGACRYYDSLLCLIYFKICSQFYFYLDGPRTIRTVGVALYVGVYSHRHQTDNPAKRMD
jgi:hypothetical protein